MSKVKGKEGLVPLLGGFFALIAFLTPAAYKYNKYIWFWALKARGSYYYWVEDAILLPLSIIISILMITKIISIIRKSNKVRTGEVDFEEIKKSLIKKSIWLIVLMIIWVVGHEIFCQVPASYNLRGQYPYIPKCYQFWGVLYDPGFGIIGTVIGSIIVIIGVQLPKWLDMDQKIIRGESKEDMKTESLGGREAIGVSAEPYEVTEDDYKRARRNSILLVIAGAIFTDLALTMPYLTLYAFAMLIGTGLGFLLLGIFGLVLYKFDRERLEKILIKKKRSKAGEKVEMSKASKRGFSAILIVLVVVLVVVIIAALVIASQYGVF